ncbi:hypothetical protein CEXT_323861, partial [Caerostris extrusa]
SESLEALVLPKWLPKCVYLTLKTSSYLYRSFLSNKIPEFSTLPDHRQTIEQLTTYHSKKGANQVLHG